MSKEHNMGIVKSALASLTLVTGMMAAPSTSATPDLSLCPNGMNDTVYPHSADIPASLGAPTGSDYGILLNWYTDKVTGRFCGAQADAFMQINGGPHWGAINVYLQGCYVGSSLMTVPADFTQHDDHAPPSGLCLAAAGATATVYAYYGSTRLTDLSTHQS